MTDTDALKHTVGFVLSLRGRKAGESAGTIAIQITQGTAAEILEWIEIPLAMLRAQASEAAHDNT